MKTRFLDFFELRPTLSVGSSTSTLAVNTPPHKHQCKNLKVAEKLSMCELRLCKKFECCEKVELMYESPNLCERFTI